MIRLCITELWLFVGLNVEFIKRLVVSLECQFIRLSKSVPAAENHYSFQFNTVVKYINCRIEMFEKTILDNQNLHTLSNNVEQLYVSNKNKLSDIENEIPKQLVSVQGLIDQNMENMKHILTSNNEELKLNLDDFDQQLSKKPKLISNDVYNVLDVCSKSGMYYSFIKFNS